MTDKIKKLLPGVTLIIGFILGRVTESKISKKEEVTVSSQILTQKEHVQTQAEIKKDSMVSQRAIYVEKHYSNSGKLKSEIYTATNYGAIVAMDDSHKTAIVNEASQDSEIKSNTITSHQSNWGVGLFYPADKNYIQNFQPTKFQAQISYRVFGSFYLSGQSNINFTQKMIGILYQTNF